MADIEQRIVGTIGTALQLQATKRREWTSARRATFLDHLAATCNVRQSAKAVGLTDTAAHAFRRRDPVFAAQWSAALAAGREQLEAKLLARALAQGEPEMGADPSAIDTGPFDPAEARLLVQQLSAAERNGGGGRGARVRAVKHATIEEVRAALLVKLAILRKRLAKEAA